MSTDSRLHDLLLRWEEARDQGGAGPSAEELCADCPELLEEARRRIRALERMNPLLADSDSEDDADLEEIDRPLPEPEKTLAFVRSRQREDGGYVEIPPMKRSGTNPTAAAQAVIQILESNASKERDEATADFLLNLVSFEGGILANNRIPMADLLSTFTGLWTLHELDALKQLDVAKALRYVQSLERPEGGFLAGLWDESVDVEYTFYGLASLALLAGGGSSA